MPGGRPRKYINGTSQYKLNLSVEEVAAIDSISKQLFGKAQANRTNTIRLALYFYKVFGLGSGLIESTPELEGVDFAGEALKDLLEKHQKEVAECQMVI
jgi:hypothetical protein